MASSSTIATAAKITDDKLKASIIREACNSPIPVYAQDLRDICKLIKNEEGYYDVMIHGAPDFVEYEHKYCLDADTFAMIISGRKDYRPDLYNVRLLACSTGKADKDGKCFAQELAKKLGVNVKAPIGDLIIDKDSGKLTVGRGIPFEQASKIFTPEGGIL